MVADGVFVSVSVLVGVGLYNGVKVIEAVAVGDPDVCAGGCFCNGRR